MPESKVHVAMKWSQMLVLAFGIDTCTCNERYQSISEARVPEMCNCVSKNGKICMNVQLYSYAQA